MNALVAIVKTTAEINLTGSGKNLMNIKTTIKKLVEIKKYAQGAEKTALFSAVGYLRKYQMILENPELVRQSARWIVHDDGSCNCTRCGRKVSEAESKVSYCSGCGAKMIGKTNYMQNRRN